MDVAVDHNGDIYVADRENHLLQVYLMAMCASAHANTCLARARANIRPAVGVSRAGVWGRRFIFEVSWGIRA